MVKSNKYSVGYQLFTVLIGALLMGFLWRVRGTHGWGSSWGLLNAGFIFTMFITMVMGERKKMNFGWLAITSLMFMLTVPAWGTLLDQITGVLFDASEISTLIPFNSAYASDVYCSVPSAIYIMLTLGFGLASLYGIMLGRAYSDKQWKIQHYIILIAVFFVAGLVAKATVSHWILNIIQPEASEAFEIGLKDYMLTLVSFDALSLDDLKNLASKEFIETFEATVNTEYEPAFREAFKVEFIENFKLTQNLDGISFDDLKALIVQSLPQNAVEAFENAVTKKSIDGSAWQVYLKHFDDVSWAKKAVPAGSIGRNYFQSVEMISLAISAVASLITTRFIIKDKRAANTGFVVCGAFAFAITAADLFFYFGDGGYHQLAENYFGDNVAPWSCWEYFTGFIAGGIITAHMLRLKPQEDVEDLAFNKVPEKLSKILTFVLGYLFLIGVSIVRPVLERFDESKLQILYVANSVLVAVGIVAILAKKWGIAAEKTNMVNISSTLLPLFMALIIISYMFLCSRSYQNYTSITMVHNILVVVSLIAVDIWIIIQTKKLKT
ncbi:MAG: hypothetical protein IJA87_04995 [Clostridia bacterium]|nr:hypothetical protein [Clostridia bacterium]